MSEHKIRRGQVYETCDPRETIRIRVVNHKPGANRTDVVDAITGKRPRSILSRSLHASGMTERGTKRRTGYRLVEEAPDA